MNRYVDIHAHVLYGIDDGPADRADAEAMLRTAARSGTAVIVATPHLRSDFPDVHVNELAARADELRAWIAEQGLEIELINGGEVGLVWALDADDEALRLGSYGQRGGDLLIETPNTIVGLEALLYQVRTRGFRVTLAHPERSREFQRDPSTLEALVERGILLQINADALLGDPRRSPTANLAHQLCLDGLAHAVASDSHRATQWRPVNVMPYAVAAAAELVGAERAEWLAVDSPAAIVAGRPLPEPPPIVSARRGRWPFSRD
jgi:protein-tyrosine phosphatase